VSNQLLDSIKWSALGEITSKVLPPLFYIITARILTPRDFGVVATSAMVVAFASIFWEAGLSKALIQNQEHENLQKMSNIVLFTNMILSVFFYILLFFSSNYIASFFNDQRISGVIQISGLSLIIGSLMSVQTALLQKFFEFKKLFFIRLVGTIIPGIVSVVLAYFGYGYWALIYGTIASMILQAIILWKISTWRPSYEYDFAVAKKMFHFSKWVLLSALLSWFFIWGDIFVLGFFFTSHELGLYRTGSYFVVAVIGLVTTPIVPVMYSYFSKIQHDIDSVKRTLLLCSKVVSFFVLPIGVGLYIAQNPLSDLIFGEKWVGIGSVIGYLALTHGFAWIVGLNTDAYKAIGKPNIEFFMQLITVPIYMTVFFLSSKISFIFFLQARLSLVFIGIGIQSYFMKNILGIKYYELLENIKYILIVSILCIFLNYLFLNNFYTSYFSMFFILLTFVSVYLIFIYIFDKKLIITFIDIFKKKKLF
jgi:PST family polysaccharide transporter